MVDKMYSNLGDKRESFFSARYQHGPVFPYENGHNGWSATIFTILELGEYLTPAINSWKARLVSFPSEPPIYVIAMIVVRYLGICAEGEAAAAHLPAASKYLLGQC